LSPAQHLANDAAQLRFQIVDFMESDDVLDALMFATDNVAPRVAEIIGLLADDASQYLEPMRETFGQFINPPVGIEPRDGALWLFYGMNSARVADQWRWQRVAVEGRHLAAIPGMDAGTLYRLLCHQFH
jgi:hypothetical protein